MQRRSFHDVLIMLYRDHRDRMVSALARKTQRPSRELAEQLTQETFARAFDPSWNTLLMSAYEGAGCEVEGALSLCKLLYTINYGALRDACKRHAFRREIAVDLEIPAHMGHCPPLAEQAAEARQTLRCIMGAVNPAASAFGGNRPDELRAAIVDLIESQDDIVAVAARHPAVHRSNLNRARSWLRAVAGSGLSGERLARRVCAGCGVEADAAAGMAVRRWLVEGGRTGPYARSAGVPTRLLREARAAARAMAA